ncbi:MAG TPA: M23 family metallopeptidase [bacterium]|nr:M23 family metallopeptidase [bacterium]
MKKYFSGLIVALLVLAQVPAFANIPSADEEGGVVEFDLSSAPDFFLEDANDLSPSLGADLPDIMPCNGVVTSDYGWRRISRRRGRMHLGVDIAAPYGSPIVAPADGRVAFVGRKGGYGLTIILEHGGNLTTLFAHNSEIFVKEGDTVRRGQNISAIGMSGHSTGPHVHYEIRVDGSAVNPGKYL